MRRFMCSLVLLLSACGGSSQSPTTAVTQNQAVQAITGPVIFIGDSLTQGWSAEGLYGTPIADPTLNVLVPGSINAGISGQTSVQMLARFQTDVLAHNPGIVVILAGTNDLRSIQNPTIDAVSTMAEEASAAGARVLIGLIPRQEIWTVSPFMTEAETLPAEESWNAQLKTLAAEYGYGVIDYYSVLINADGTQNLTLFLSDGIHPNQAGYAAMWTILQPALID